MRKARAAGAEVVDRDAHAERAQLLEHDARALDVAHHARLRDLELQPSGLAAGAGEDLLEIRDHGRIAKLRRRKIHADDDVAEPCVAPRARLPARGIEHPVADRVAEAGFVGERNEAGRQREAALGIMPAQQRLGAPHFSRLDIDDGLVVQLELVFA